MNPLSVLGDTVGGLLGHLAQQQRLLRVHTPLGPDVLFAEDIEVWEGIGPMNGPALGDEADAASLASGGSSGRWAVDASLGPTRAGLRLVVHALGRDAHLELKTLIGQPALVELLCQESRSELRPWHGHIVAAALMGSDGGLARYRLVIEPWLAVLAHRVDAWVFQDLSVAQIIDDVFAGYDGQGKLIPAWRWELADASVYLKRSLCIQYHESDLDFVQRLMREEGLVCWWEHTGEAASPSLGNHTLVIADHNCAMQPNRQPAVRFTASDHTLEADSLTRWASVSRVASGRVAMRSRDHRGLGARPVEASVGVSAGAGGGGGGGGGAGVGSLPSGSGEASGASPSGAAAPLSELIVVDVPGGYAYEDTEQGQRLAGRQAEALAACRTRAIAAGPWRRAQVATSFTLSDHPRHDGSDPGQDRFVVLAAQHRARNNFTADEAARFVGLTRAILRDQGKGAGKSGKNGKNGQGDKPGGHAEAPLHEAALLVQPLCVPVRMGASDPAPHGPPAAGHWGVLGRGDERTVEASPSLFEPQAAAALGQPEVRLNVRPTVRGTQTAIVVGGADADIATDRDGRIRVQFHWQRGSASSHRLGAGEGEDNAPASAASFTWVRVGASLAGANFGAVFTPRVGHEVLVAFTGGDIDRPVVIGAVYDGRGAPDAQGNEVAAGAALASGNAPAWFAGQQKSGSHEGHQHRAVLLGHKSQELGASRSGLGGSNQLVFDDSAGGNRIELASTTEASRLQLGSLLQQEDNQRLGARGHGLELTTAAHGALRAGSGLLVSAHAQAASTGTGQQLQAREPMIVLESAQSLVHTLIESAQAHNAKLRAEPAVAGAAAKERAKQLPAEQGLYALIDSVQGTDTSQSAAAARAAGAGPGHSEQTHSDQAHSDQAVAIDGGFGSVAAWGRPDLVLAAPAGIGLFTPAAAVVSAGSNVTMSAGQDLHAVAQGNHATVAKAGVVLYTYGKASSTVKPNAETGIALHAASGSVLTSSNTGATRLTSSGAIDVTSTKASVLVASPRHVLMTAAGAAIRIEAGNIAINAPGAVRFKAGMKVLTGAGSASQSLESKTGKLDDCPWMKA